MRYRQRDGFLSSKGMELSGVARCLWQTLYRGVYPVTEQITLV